MAIAVLALWQTIPDLWTPIQYYDEGILLTGAHLILHGQAPYRDFYSNYPPGIFYLIAGLWKLFGVSVMAYRYLGLALHVLVAVLAGRLAGRISGRRFVWLATGLTLTWIKELEGSPSAYLAALALGLLFAELFLRAREDAASRTSWLFAGLALGAISCFRHDLFVYLMFVLGALALWGLWRKHPLTPRGVGWIAIGAAVPVLAVWIPTLARAGMHQVATDLYLDQVRYVLPARVLPVPAIFTPVDFPGTALRLPPFLVSLPEGGVFLSLVGPVVGGLALWMARRRRLPIALVAAIAAAVLPQMLGRIDLPHTLYTVTPAIILLCGLTDALALQASQIRIHGNVFRVLLHALPLWIVVAWLLTPARNVLWPLRKSFPHLKHEDSLPRFDPLPAEHLDERKAVLAFISDHTNSDDPIYVGCWSHRIVLVNDLDLYFLANRRGATRYMQFDPNVVTRADVQQLMIEELERNKPKVAILAARELWFEPNLSSQAGAFLLDEYLKSKYRTVETRGMYRMLLRK